MPSLLSRVEQQFPDVAFRDFSLASHHHSQRVLNKGNCHDCAACVEAGVSILPDLRRLILEALRSDDALTILRASPSLASEMLAGGWTQNFLHLVANGVLLDVKKEHSQEPFLERVQDFLWPKPIGSAATKPPLSLVRKILYDKPASFSVPRDVPTVDDVALVQATSDVFLQLKDVPDQLSVVLQRRESLDAAGETWAAYLRLALPRQTVFLSDTWRISVDGTIESLRQPEHRRRGASKTLARISPNS